MVITKESIELLRQAIAERSINDLAQCERAKQKGQQYVLVDQFAIDREKFYKEALWGLRMVMSPKGVNRVLELLKQNPNFRIFDKDKGESE